MIKKKKDIFSEIFDDAFKDLNAFIKERSISTYNVNIITANVTETVTTLTDGTSTLTDSARTLTAATTTLTANTFSLTTTTIDLNYGVTEEASSFNSTIVNV